MNSKVFAILVLSLVLVFQNCGKSEHSGTPSTVDKEELVKEQESVKVVFSENFDGATAVTTNSKANSDDFGSLELVTHSAGKYTFLAKGGVDDSKAIELEKAEINLTDAVTINSNKGYRISLYARIMELDSNGATPAKPFFSLAIVRNKDNKSEVLGSKDITLDTLQWTKYTAVIKPQPISNDSIGDYVVDFSISSSLATDNIVQIDNILVEEIN